MKKLVVVFISIMIVIFVSVSYMVHIDNKYMNNINKTIANKTGIKKINYVNHYDNYYIVLTDDYLYLYSDKFVELLKLDNILIHQNNKNYDIIYNNKQLMYFNDYIKGKKNVFEYYDLYTYELIDRIVLE